MKTRRFLWSMLAVMMVNMLSMSVASCGGDDDDLTNPNGGQTVSPGKTVSDPAGTVSLSMRNASNGKTYLDNIYINSGDNFTGGYFVSIGEVKGLGNVSGIPTTGWAEQVAVKPSNGYVAFSNGNFYRIYVEDYITGVSGGVIGADVKYQKPFKGADEAISLDEKSLTFGNEGGSQSLVFNNKNLVVFTATSDQDWCRVEKSSTYDHYFLYNGITVFVDPSSSASEETATITLKTAYDKMATVKVIRAGAIPVIEMGEVEREISPDAQTFNVGFSTNLDINNLQVSGTKDWLSANIVDGTSSMRTKAARVKFIGNKTDDEVNASYSSNSARSYSLELTAKSNYNQSERQAAISVKSIDNKASKSITIKQQHPELSAEATDWHINAKGLSSAVYFTSNISNENLHATSDAMWLTITGISQQTVSYTVTDNTTGKERKATITITPKEGNLKLAIDVFQAASELRLSKNVLYFDKNSGNQTITVTEDLNNWEVEGSSETWCTCSTNGNALTVRVTAATKDREAIIKFKNHNETLKVIQSKYAVGDEYSEDKVTGTVGYMQDGLNYIYKEVGQAAWSTEYVVTGATDMDNGRNNMEIIKKIPNWEELYPAFALCDALNTGGVTGWYLPSYNEVRKVVLGNVWSSTEYVGSNMNGNQENCAYTRNGIYKSGWTFPNVIKRSIYNVVSFKRF